MLTGPFSDCLISLAPEIVRADKKILPDLLNLAQRHLSNLLGSAEISFELCRYLTDASDGRAVPIEDGKQGEIVFHQDNLVFISIATYDEQAKVLHSHPVRGVFQVLQGSPFIIERFHLPEGWNPDDPPADTRLKHFKTERVAPGDLVSIDGSSEVLWFRYESEVVVAKYIVSLPAAQSWSFAPGTLKPLDAESAQGRHDALVHAADLLRAIRSVSSLDSVLIAAMCHDVHFVRWAAMRAAAAISCVHGIELLTVALNDRNSVVRSSAEKALAYATKARQS